MIKPHDRNEVKLNNKILSGLSIEWDLVTQQLEIIHSIKLKKPLFSLKPLSQKLAFWDPVKREICFSLDFVHNYSWGDIKDVLLHEIAHQLTSEYLKAGHESPHGESFHKACKFLKANPKASGRYQPLSERILDPELNENDKIMLKVRKLLALAKSSHIHEAEAAVAKAHQLIAKYNVDMIELAEKRAYVSIYIGRPALRHFREEYALANFITENYFVFGIWVSAYVLEKEKLGRVLEISGTPQNVKMASYVYDFISNHIDMAWERYNKDRKLNRYRKTDFATGIIEGLRSKLIQGKPAKHQDKHLPVKIEDHQLGAYTSYKYPRIKNFQRKSSSVDPEIRSDGEKIGKKLVISRGIEKKGTDGKKYLDASS